MQSNPKAHSLPAYYQKKVESSTTEKLEPKRVITAFANVSFLVSWISMSLFHNSLFLREAIICSFVIVCILLLREVDQQQEYSK